MNLKTEKEMGRIEDQKDKRRRRDTDDPLDEFGNRNEQTNDFDIDEKTIRDQKNKE